MAFQFASTNLVLELGIVLWVLMGWQFTAAEWVGGTIMIGNREPSGTLTAQSDLPAMFQGSRSYDRLAG